MSMASASCAQGWLAFSNSYRAGTQAGGQRDKALVPSGKDRLGAAAVELDDDAEDRFYSRSYHGHSASQCRSMSSVSKEKASGVSFNLMRQSLAASLGSGKA